MTPDPDLLTSPAFILLAWGAGLAAAASLVTWWRIVGPGFTWLASGVTALVLLGGIASEQRTATWVALAGSAAAAVLARRAPRSAAISLGAAAVAALLGAAYFGGWPLAISGALALGGVTGEMLLGHWYLVDPTLPRWALKALDGAGVVGLVLDGILLMALAPVPLFGAFDGTTIAYLALSVMSIVLMVLVWFALDYPAYSGVMAATGLSYLAVLTALGAVFVGRAVGSGTVLFGGL